MRRDKDKVLVTGATGFVGANLIRRLLIEDYKVYITIRRTSNPWRINDILPQLILHEMDLIDGEKVKKIIGKIRPDIIFHLANAGVYGGIHLPEKQLIETNFLGTVNLINACNEIDYRCFVNTGSSAEYGLKTEPMRENDICEPITMYGITKCAATQYGNLIAKKNNKPIIALRLFSPFGPYDDKSRLITYAIINALQNKDLNLANPEAARDYVYIEDVLDLYIKCIDKADDFKGEIFNIGSGSQTKISYVVDKIIELTNSKSLVKWNTIAPRDFDAKIWEANINKTCKYLNWKSRYLIDRGIEETISWFKNNLTLYNKNEV